MSEHTRPPFENDRKQAVTRIDRFVDGGGYEPEASLLAISTELYDIAQRIGREKYINAGFDCGYLMAAVELIEGGFIGDDYEPLRKERDRRNSEQLMRALAAVKDREV